MAEDIERHSAMGLLKELLARAAALFHLWDKTDKAGAVATIVEGIEFRGATLWSLMIAILLASIGLNVNSTALIIGAMLVSPLMGPIMGAGLALGTSDLPLLRRSLVNLGIMTGVSLAVSTLWFAVTPLHGATSEILARTTPTFFDVLVALFGGAAMIIAVSRTSRSTNTIAGVAVATALMPPLCTAGYGLATGSWGVFAGAGYLYLINSVFIGLTTFLFTKYLRLGAEKASPLPTLRRRSVIVLAIAAVVFLAPSVWMAVDLIQNAGFSAKVQAFADLNLQFPDSSVTSISSKRGHPSMLTVTLAGTPISSEMIAHLQSQLPASGLSGTELKVIQTAPGSALPAKTIEESATAAAKSSAFELALREKEARILELEGKLAHLEDRGALLDLASREVVLLFPELESLSWGELEIRLAERVDTTVAYTVFATWRKGAAAPSRKALLATWLRLRFDDEALVIVDR